MVRSLSETSIICAPGRQVLPRQLAFRHLGKNRSSRKKTSGPNLGTPCRPPSGIRPSCRRSRYCILKDSRRSHALV